jgi:hypothetical protein
MIEPEPRAYGAHGLRRTKVALNYKKAGNLGACPLLPGHRKRESTARCLGIEVDDALEMSEQIDFQGASSRAGCKNCDATPANVVFWRRVNGNYWRVANRYIAENRNIMSDKIPDTSPWIRSQSGLPMA